MGTFSSGLAPDPMHLLRVASLAFIVACTGTMETTSGTPRPPRADAGHGDGGPVEPPEDVWVVTMPLEVQPPDGSSVHEEPLVLRTSERARMVYVVLSEAGYDKSLLGEQGGYDQMASMRVDGGEWIPLSNDQMMRFPESRLGGVWGIRHQVRMMVPMDIPAGQVRLDFRFDGTEGTSSGYRVLEVDLFADAVEPNEDGRSVLDRIRFEAPDFAAWGPPPGYDDPASIEAGRDLWHHAPLRESPLSDTVLASSCESCHAEGSFDLKYFNYSNRSIETRSAFHGLSPQQGKQIAAYVRSLDLGFPEGYDVENCGGRPWNPPYQPGTRSFGSTAGQKLSELPVQCWAAGAGRDAVLDHDGEMEPFLHQQWEAGNFAWDEHVELIDIPLAIAFEVWNRWLPDRHPYDVFGAERWQASRAHEAYLALQTALETTPLSLLVEGVTFNQFGPTGGVFSLVNDFHVNSQRGMLPDDADQYTADDEWPFIARHSVHQWQSVKLLGLSWRHGLEDLGREVYADAPRDHGGDRHAADPALWFSRDRMSLQTWRGFFDVAPHMNSKTTATWPGAAGGQAYTGWRDASAYPGPQGGRPSVGGPVSCTWYATQMILNDGGGTTGTQAPMDWKYNWTLCSDYGGLVGEETYFYHVLSQVVEQQNAFGGPYAFSFDETRRNHGVDWPSIAPWWRIFYDDAPNRPSSLDPGSTVAQVWEPRVWDPLLTAIETHEAQPWSRGTAEEELIAYARAPESDCTRGRVECRSFTPRLGGRVNLQTGLGHNLFNAMQRYGEAGVSPEIAERIARVFSRFFTGVPEDLSLSPVDYWMSAYR